MTNCTMKFKFNNIQQNVRFDPKKTTDLLIELIQGIFENKSIYESLTTFSYFRYCF